MRRSLAEMTYPALAGRVTKLMLNAWTIVSGVVLVSIQLVQDSAFDVDSFVADRLGEAIGRKLAVEAVSGTGSTACLGVVTALAAKGVWGGTGTSGGYIQLGTGTTVNTYGGSSTELALGCPGAESLLSMIAAVDPAYRNDPQGNPTAAFWVNDQQLKGLRSLVDNYGHGLLVPDPSRGGAPTLWGYPVMVDNSLTGMSASTVTGPLFGAMDKAMVARLVRNEARVVTDTHPINPNVMRLTERYADYLEVGYLAYVRADTRSNDMRAVTGVRSSTS